jgi:choice-of-anchor B domain-containing protein
MLSLTGDPTAAYTHQGWLTPDHRWFLFGDEVDEQEHGQNTTTYIMNAVELDAPATPVAFLHQTRSIDHNLYIHGKHVYEFNYMAGLQILEYDRKSLAAGQLREIAFFDVVPALDEPEFAGTWSNYRFPGSGTTVVSVIENELSGLLVLRPQLGDGRKGGGGEGRT